MRNNKLINNILNRYIKKDVIDYLEKNKPDVYDSITKNIEKVIDSSNVYLPKDMSDFDREKAISDVSVDAITGESISDEIFKAAEEIDAKIKESVDPSIIKGIQEKTQDLFNEIQKPELNEISAAVDAISTISGEADRLNNRSPVIGDELTEWRSISKIESLNNELADLFSEYERQVDFYSKEPLVEPINTEVNTPFPDIEEVVQADEPNIEPIEPDVDPIEPSIENIEPSVEPVEPSVEPLEPSFEPPPIEPIEPSFEPPPIEPMTFDPPPPM